MATGSIRIGLAAVFMITGTAFCQLRTDKLGVGLTGTGSSFRGDSPSSGTRYGGGLSLMYSVASHIGIRATFQFDQMQFTPLGEPQSAQIEAAKTEDPRFAEKKAAFISTHTL
jgi:hypothetical protein